MAASGQPPGATPSRPHQPDTQSAPGVGTASIHHGEAGDTQLLCWLAARITSAHQIGKGLRGLPSAAGRPSAPTFQGMVWRPCSCHQASSNLLSSEIGALSTPRSPFRSQLGRQAEWAAGIRAMVV